MKKKNIGLLLTAVLLCVFSAYSKAEEPTRPTSTPEPTPVPTATPTPEATDLPEGMEELILQVEPQEDLTSKMAWTVFDDSGPVTDYRRNPKEWIHMPAGDKYTRLKIGVLAYRNDAFRHNAAVGTVNDPSGLKMLWEVDTLPSADSTVSRPGNEWTGQPLISKWSVEIREAANMYEEKKAQKALKEVILPGADGLIRFLDLKDGTQTRNAVDPGAPVIGTSCLAPAGYPYLGVMTEVTEHGSKSFLQYNLYTQEELTSGNSSDKETGSDAEKERTDLSSTTEPIESDPASEPFDQVVISSSPVIDRISDTVITAGEDGMLYLINLHCTFDYRDKILAIEPSYTAMSSVIIGDQKPAAVQSPLAAYDKYVFYADMAGILRCVDTNTMAPLWMAETGDAVVSAVALDQRDGDSLDLYTANTLTIRESGDAQIRKYNALNGEEIWRRDFGINKNTDKDIPSGFIASPVIGENELNNLVYYTVTGISDEGCRMLGIADGTPAAVAAISKETGRIIWARELENRCVSSPVAVYDQEGNGWIIQCGENGTILLLEGMTGHEVASLSIEGDIVSSPAVYGDIMVIRTTGSTTGTIYGIQIESGANPE